MNCKAVQNQLSAYLDRELTGAEMLTVRGHLMECADCRAEEESLRSLKRLLAASTVPEPSADLADRLCASVLSTRKCEDRPAGPIITVRGALTFAGVAACSMAITYALFTHPSPAGVAPAPSTMAAADNGQDVGFDVQRDSVYAGGLDATDGIPVLMTPGNLDR